MAVGQPQRELLDEVVARLEDLGLPAEVKSHDGHDAHAMVTIDIDGRSVTLHTWLVPINDAVTGLIANVLRQIRPQGDSVVVTDHVSHGLAERLREQDVQFVDSAGNMYIRQQGVVLWVVGRRRRTATPIERRTRAFRRAGLQIVFTLLADPDLVRAPYRVIADRADTSLGAVTPVLQDLRDLGYVVGPDDKRSMQRANRLLTTWTEAFAQTLRPKLLIERFYAEDPLWWHSVDPTRYDVAWGGETAAELLTSELRPETATVYANSLPQDLLIAARLRRDPTGNIEVRRRFWTSPLPVPRPEVVPAPLIYADLVAAGDARSGQAAEQIRKDYLDRPDRT